MGFGKEVWKNNHLRDVLTSKVRTNDATMQETWLRWGGIVRHRCVPLQ